MKPLTLAVPAISEFRPESELLRGTPGVYLLFMGPRLVYVGQSSNIFLRLQQHRREGKKEFDEVRFYRIPDESSRLRIEALLIIAKLPRYNKIVSIGINHEGGTVYTFGTFNTNPDGEEPQEPVSRASRLHSLEEVIRYKMRFSRKK